MNLKSFLLKVAVLEWLRYEELCPVVATEAWWNSDVVGVTPQRRLMEVEIKTSMDDLRAEANKWSKHHHYSASFARKMPTVARVPSRFYFAVPAEMIERALVLVKERYPHAGLLAPLREDSGRVFVVLRAPFIHIKSVDIRDLWKMVRSQSATLVRLYRLEANLLLEARLVPPLNDH